MFLSCASQIGPMEAPLERPQRLQSAPALRTSSSSTSSPSLLASSNFISPLFLTFSLSLFLLHRQVALSAWPAYNHVWPTLAVAIVVLPTTASLLFSSLWTPIRTAQYKWQFNLSLRAFDGDWHSPTRPLPKSKPANLAAHSTFPPARAWLATRKLAVSPKGTLGNSGKQHCREWLVFVFSFFLFVAGSGKRGALKAVGKVAQLAKARRHRQASEQPADRYISHYVCRGREYTKSALVEFSGYRRAMKYRGGCS